MKSGSAPDLSRWLLAILLIGVVGTETELLLLGHYEDWQQWIPVVLLGIGVPVVAWALVSSSSAAAKLLRVTMTTFVISGLVGVWFHYSGNVEFEKEMAADAAGWGLFSEAMTGATPALAPGTMIWFGLIGLILGWKSPAKR